MKLSLPVAVFFLFSAGCGSAPSPGVTPGAASGTGGESGASGSTSTPSAGTSEPTAGSEASTAGSTASGSTASGEPSHGGTSSGLSGSPDEPDASAPSGSSGAPVEAGSETSTSSLTNDGGGATPDAATSSDAIELAPYFPTWAWGGNGYAYSSLVDLMHKSGVSDVTIAFVLSSGGCKADNGIEQNISDVKAFLAAGGHVKASFGGADGTYVEAKCADAASLATALGDFVDATGITDLDFDIEQDPVLTDSVNQMRGTALAMVQASKNIQVAFTLAANPPPGGGLTQQGLSVVSHALSAGVHVSHVNLMTMDYGDQYAGKPLGPVVTGSLTDANAQLVKLMPGTTTAQAWRMIGVIPMIGKNDDSEVFSIADAMTLEQFAIQNRIGLVSFWSMDRDQVCAGGADYNSCSTVDTVNFQFATTLLPVTTH
jgi:hypothetical protein